MDIRTQNRLQSFLVPFLVALIVLALSQFGLLTGVRGAIDSVVVPMKRSVVPIRQQFDIAFGIVRVGVLQTEIAQLRIDAARLLVDQTERIRLQEENQALRAQLEAPFAPDQELVPVHIIGIGTDSFTIDAGDRQGLREGLAVVVEENILGVVSAVFAQTSVVHSVTHPDSKIPAETVATNARGIAVQIGGTLTLDKVLQANDIQSGDIVVTSGHELTPRDLVIGTVSDVQFEEQDLFKRAVIDQVIDYQDVVTVFVIVN